MQNVVYDGKKDLTESIMNWTFLVKSFTDKEFTVKWHKNDNLAIKTATSLYQSGNFKADQLNESWNKDCRYTCIFFTKDHPLVYVEYPPAKASKTHY